LKLSLTNGPNKLFVSSATTIDEFCSYLSRVTGRTVVDKTDLSGKFDIRLEYLPFQITPNQNQITPRNTAVDQLEGPADVELGASLFTAVQQQLGLKLVPVKGARQVIVIDHIEKPSGN